MGRVKKITELQRITPDEFRQAEKIPLVVVLDNVRSLNNIGSVFRTADAFRVAAVYLCGITATPPHAEIHKTALGAEDSVEWRYFEQTEDAVAHLIREGYTLCAIEQVHNSLMLDEFEPLPDARYAIVLGNEVKGVQQQVVDMCHCSIEIPQFGTKHSLNISVAAAIAMWHFWHKTRRV